MSTAFLLNTLACAVWTLWCAFAIDVARAATDVVRGSSRPELRDPHRPVHMLATLLVGTAVTALLLNRPDTVSRPAPLRATTDLPLHPDIFEAPSGPVHNMANTLPETASYRVADTSQRPPHTVTVRPPDHGIHDSLWRIAARTLGDGGRWPEIYALNRDRPQPDGEVLTNPGLIRPGWVLQLPAEVPPKRPDNPAPEVPPGTTPAPSSEPNPDSPTGTATEVPRPPGPDTHRAPGLDLPTGAYVGLGLAALITAAAATMRRRRRVRYQPGSGERGDLTIAPVVRALRMAHDQAIQETDDDTTMDIDTEVDPPPRPPDEPLRAGARHHAEPLSPATRRVIGVREGQSLAWDLAHSRGLGLVGAGAMDAARALAVAGVAERHGTAAGHLEILVPAQDAARLLGEDAADIPCPAGLRIVEDLDAALNVLEAEILTRARHARDDGTSPTSNGIAGVALLLIASPVPDSDGRLQSLLENGSSLGLAGVLLGQWRPGRTLCVGQDGTVSVESSPEADADEFAGAGLFTMPAPDARALLDLLQELEPAAPSAESSSRALTLAVMGPVRLTHHPRRGADDNDLTRSLAPKQREILAYLALHRHGARREALIAAIWPDAPSEHPYNSFHATLSQFRRTLRTATGDEISNIVHHLDGRYVLDHGQVSVDLWELQDSLHEAGTAGKNDELRRDALERGTGLYAGDFATDIVSEWCEAPREALRRDVLDGLAALTRDVSASDPHQALVLLERSRSFDRYNEAIYRDIARVQARLGLQAEIPRTLSLLSATLAEVDEEPCRETIALCEALQRRGSPTGAVRGRDQSAD
ncbi:hypothetical protein [Streptomyces fractus]|uniref:hypothetical protein n=1 Tax=Streptomyces fractus TaxID=641806 RepID=UPI003CEAC759